MKDDLSMKVLDEISDISGTVEFLGIEIENELSKTATLSMGHRSHNEDFLTFENQLINIFSKNGIAKKSVILTGDFDIHLLDFKGNKKLRA